LWALKDLPYFRLQQPWLPEPDILNGKLRLPGFLGPKDRPPLFCQQEQLCALGFLQSIRFGLPICWTTILLLRSCEEKLL
jgi:hypothetical protein